MGYLDGAGAVVTGGSRGIGRAIVRRLAADGATVVFSYVANEPAAGNLVTDVTANGGTATAVQADAADAAAVERLFQTAEDVFTDTGVALRVCVLNAGMADHAPLAEVSTQRYDAIMAVNARGAFLALQQAARRTAHNGRIVAISSTGTAWPSAGEAVYAASKAALEQFVRVASRELGHRGVTVNIVSPGPTDTDLLRADVTPEARAEVAHMTALGRVGQPVDIANVVSALLSPDAAWLTGQNLRADGGLV
ncbi:MAG: SDR family oxidoreductase [Pseudonocardiaceae bacterium]